MAVDTARNLIWQVNVGGDNGIYGLDPADGSVEQVITGAPWDGISQRGLAYDPDADVFYIGGWNEGIVYRGRRPVASDAGRDAQPVHAARSEHLRARLEPLVRDALDVDELRYRLDLADRSDHLRGEREHPASGWRRRQRRRPRAGRRRQPVDRRPVNSGTAYLLESGLPTFSDVPWLTVDPTTATVAPDGSVDIDITVDSTGLEPGVYRALVVILTNDPDNSTFQLPVTLVVPTIQTGVDAGGNQTVSSNGDTYLADRRYGTGPYGYIGSSARRSTTHVIAGTD